METSATYTVKGMHCASCAAAIEARLAQTPGVESARVQLFLRKGAGRF